MDAGGLPANVSVVGILAIVVWWALRRFDKADERYDDELGRLRDDLRRKDAELSAAAQTRHDLLSRVAAMSLHRQMLEQIAEEHDYREILDFLRRVDKQQSL